MPSEKSDGRVILGLAGKGNAADRAAGGAWNRDGAGAPWRPCRLYHSPSNWLALAAVIFGIGMMFRFSGSGLPATMSSASFSPCSASVVGDWFIVPYTDPFRMASPPFLLPPLRTLSTAGRRPAAFPASAAAAAVLSSWLNRPLI